MPNYRVRLSLWGILPMVAIAALLLVACGAPTPSPEATAVPQEPIKSTQAVAAVATAGSTATAGSVSFASDVLPILQSRCVNCHGGQRTEKGLNVSTYDGLMKGSMQGAVIVAGDAANSKFIQLIEQGKMPKRGPKLTPDQLAILVAWINAGAPNN